MATRRQRASLINTLDHLNAILHLRTEMLDKTPDIQAQRQTTTTIMIFLFLHHHRALTLQHLANLHPDRQR